MVRSDFWTSKMATGSHLKKNIYKKVEQVIWTMFEPTAGWYKFTFGQYIYTDMYVWNEGIYIVCGH